MSNTYMRVAPRSFFNQKPTAQNQSTLNSRRNFKPSWKLFNKKTSLFQIIIGGFTTAAGIIALMQFFVVLVVTPSPAVLLLLLITAYYIFRGVSFITSASWAWYSVCADLILSIIGGVFFLSQGGLHFGFIVLMNGLLLWWCNSRRVRTNCGVRSITKKLPHIALFIVISIIVQLLIVLVAALVQ